MMIDMDKELFDKETIENLQYVEAVSGESITRIVDVFEQLCATMSESLESIFKCIEEIADNHPDDIATLKKQIKYCKNPMEMKMLNKRLNEAYKKNNRRKRKCED